MNLLNSGMEISQNRREHIEYRRDITREKFTDVMKEILEDLQKLESACIEKSALNEKLNEIENKLRHRIDKIDTQNYFSQNLKE